VLCAQALATVFSDDLFFPTMFDFDRQLGRPSSGVPNQRGIAIDVVEVRPVTLACYSVWSKRGCAWMLPGGIQNVPAHPIVSRVTLLWPSDLAWSGDHQTSLCCSF